MDVSLSGAGGDSGTCCAIILRVCYAMPATAVAYGAITLHVCYAMPGTAIAYSVITLWKMVMVRYWDRIGYGAMAERKGYGAMKCAVVTYAMAVWQMVMVGASKSLDARQ
eukprot:826148-Rhodomonas_salina.1